MRYRPLVKSGPRMEDARGEGDGGRRRRRRSGLRRGLPGGLQGPRDQGGEALLQGRRRHRQKGARSHVGVLEVEVELLKEDNEQLVTQYEREKVNKQGTEIKSRHGVKHFI